jgi:hypothetical protein
MNLPIGVVPAVCLLIGSFHLVKFLVFDRGVTQNRMWSIWLLTISLPTLIFEITRERIQPDLLTYTYFAFTLPIAFFWTLFLFIAYLRNPRSVALLTLYTDTHIRAANIRRVFDALGFLVASSLVSFFLFSVIGPLSPPCRTPKCMTGQIIFGVWNSPGTWLFFSNALFSSAIWVFMLSSFNRIFNNQFYK